MTKQGRAFLYALRLLRKKKREHPDVFWQAASVLRSDIRFSRSFWKSNYPGIVYSDVQCFQRLGRLFNLYLYNKLYDHVFREQLAAHGVTEDDVRTTCKYVLCGVAEIGQVLRYGECGCGRPARECLPEIPAHWRGVEYDCWDYEAYYTMNPIHRPSLQEGTEAARAEVEESDEKPSDMDVLPDVRVAN